MTFKGEGGKMDSIVAETGKKFNVIADELKNIIAAIPFQIPEKRWPSLPTTNITAPCRISEKVD